MNFFCCTKKKIKMNAIPILKFDHFFRRSAWLGLIYTLNIDHFWCVNSISSAHSLFGNRSFLAACWTPERMIRASFWVSYLKWAFLRRSSAGNKAARASSIKVILVVFFKILAQIFRLILSEFDLDSSLTSYPESAAAFRLSVVKKAQKAARAWWILMNFDELFKNWRIYSSNLWKFIKKKKFITSRKVRKSDEIDESSSKFIKFLVMNHRFITQNDELINHVMNFSFSAKNDVFIMVHQKKQKFITSYQYSLLGFCA